MYGYPLYTATHISVLNEVFSVKTIIFKFGANDVKFPTPVCFIDVINKSLRKRIVNLINKVIYGHGLYMTYKYTVNAI